MHTNLRLVEVVQIVSELEKFPHPYYQLRQAITLRQRELRSQGKGHNMYIGNKGNSTTYIDLCQTRQNEWNIE